MPFNISKRKMRAIYFNIDKCKNIIYEIQSITISDNVGMTPRTLHERKIKTNMIALSQDRFYRVLPDKTIQMNDLINFLKTKINQALMFLSSDLTKLYYPNSIIVSRKQIIPIESLDAQKLRAFYEKYNGNVIIKFEKTTLGKGNIFKKHASFEGFLETVNESIQNNASFLISEVSMPKNQKDYTKHNLFDTGTYERSLVICTENDLLIYPIYREILDITDITNSHDERIKLKSKEYFDENQWPTVKKKEEDMPFYQNIAKVIMETTSKLNNQTFLNNETLDKIKEYFLSEEDFVSWELNLQKNSKRLFTTNNLPKYFRQSRHIKSANPELNQAFDYLLKEKRADININILLEKYPMRYRFIRKFLAEMYFYTKALQRKEKTNVLAAIDTFFQEGDLSTERYQIFLSSIQRFFSGKIFDALKLKNILFISNPKNDENESLIKLTLQMIVEEINALSTVNHDKSVFIFLQRSKHEIKAAIKKNRLGHIKSTLLFLLDQFKITNQMEHLVSLVHTLYDEEQLSGTATTRNDLKRPNPYDQLNQQEVRKQIKPDNMDCIINMLETSNKSDETKTLGSNNLIDNPQSIFSPLKANNFDLLFSASVDDCMLPKSLPNLA